MTNSYEEEERYYLANNKTIKPNFSMYNLCRLNLATFFYILFLIFLFVIIFTAVAIFYKHPPDTDIVQEIRIDNRIRNYIIHFPKNYNRTLSYPLVVVLHPFFTNPRRFKRYNRWDETADKNQFIALYPIAYSRDKSLDFVFWNTELIISEAFIDKINDSFFIKKLIEIVTLRYNIKKGEVYCTGHSGGGNICYKTAGEHPNLFYGIAPVSSSIGGQIDKDYPMVLYRSPSYPVKLVHVHGGNDKIIKMEGGTEEAPWNLKRVFLPLQRAIDAYKITNGCFTSFISENSENNKIELRNYNCRTNQNVKIYFIKEGDHSWESLTGITENEKFKGDNLSDAIWKLLKK
eukprot:gene2350-2818_t